MLHILYQYIDNLILFNITLNSNLNKSIVRALEREKQHTPHFPESRSNVRGDSDVADNFSAC